MKNVVKKLLLFVLGVLMILSPFFAFFLVDNSSRFIYSKTYYAALVDKVNYLKANRNNKKIVIIGGSNVAFGWNSAFLEKEFSQYKVINFGLYAALGTKIMIDFARPYINHDDIVIIIPEINSNSMSLYFSGKDTWKAIETDRKLFFDIPYKDKELMAADYIPFVIEKSKYNTTIEPKGIYRRDSFNEYGDISYTEYKNGELVSKRKGNILPLHYDPSSPVSFDFSIEDEFFDYLNKFAKDVTNIGASCFYSWSPVNELSIVENDISNIENFYWYIRDHISFDVIGNPSEYIYDSHYFYDSNFHLNDNGALFHTMKFIENYKRDVELEYCTYENYYPVFPDYEDRDIDTSVDSDSAKYFKYENRDNLLEIIGVNSDCPLEIELPKVANHSRVAGIAGKAFSKTDVHTIHIPSSIAYIKDGAFSDSKITSIYMQSKKPENTNVSWDGGLIEGANTNLTIYVPKESLSDYKNDYYWGPYSHIIKGYNYEE